MNQVVRIFLNGDALQKDPLDEKLAVVTLNSSNQGVLIEGSLEDLVRALLSADVLIVEHNPSEFLPN